MTRPDPVGHQAVAPLMTRVESEGLSGLTVIEVETEASELGWSA